MTSQLDARKRYYRDTIHQQINENPRRFLGSGRNPERSEKPAGSRVESETKRAFLAGLYDGLSFGLADEIEAGWSSLGALLDDRDLAAVYDTTLAGARAEAERLQQLHPLAFGGGSIVGALANPVTYVPGGFLVQGARAASQAGKAATFASKAIALAKAGAIEGAAYGFNSGEGGLQNRLASAATEAGAGALGGALVPVGTKAVVQGGKLAREGARRAVDAVLDPATARVIGGISAVPDEAGALLEKAQLLRRRDVNEPQLNAGEVASTAYDLAFRQGQRTVREMRVMHQGLYGQGFDTSKIEMTKARMDRLGKAFVGPGHVSKQGGTRLKSADLQRQYRAPSRKDEVYGTGQPGWQANLERERKNAKKFRHNLHVNIVDLPPRSGQTP